MYGTNKAYIALCTRTPMVNKGALEVAVNDSSRSYSNISTREGPLETFCFLRFRMETLASVLSSIRQVD